MLRWETIDGISCGPHTQGNHPCVGVARSGELISVQWGFDTPGGIDHPGNPSRVLIRIPGICFPALVGVNSGTQEFGTVSFLNLELMQHIRGRLL